MTNTFPAWPSLLDDGGRISIALDFDPAKASRYHLATYLDSLNPITGWHYDSGKDSIRLVFRPMPWFWIASNKKNGGFFDALHNLKTLGCEAGEHNTMTIWSMTDCIGHDNAENLEMYMFSHQKTIATFMDMNFRHPWGIQDNGVFQFPIMESTIYSVNFLRNIEFCKAIERWVRDDNNVNKPLPAFLCYIRQAEDTFKYLNRYLCYLDSPTSRSENASSG
jgi:hypothetical protein